MSGVTRPLVRALVAATVVAVTAAAGVTTAARPAAAVARDVLLVGDSIFAALGPAYTNDAQDVIAAAGWNVTLDAVSGRPTSAGDDVLTARADELRDVVVVHLGNNDHWRPSTFRTEATALLTRARDLGVQAVLWTTMREAPSIPGNADINAVLRDLDRQWPMLHLVEWNAQAATNTAWFQPDGLHLSVAGANAMAQLLLVELTSWYAAQQSPRPTCGTPSVPTAVPSAAAASGYWLLDSSGRVWTYGGAGQFGDLRTKGVKTAPASMQATPTGLGYWIVDTRGVVHAFGDAVSAGDMSGRPLNGPVRRIEAPRVGPGYWLVASDGGVFAFGNAPFHGSTGAMRLNRPVISMASTATGAGYWLVASDGGVFAFGNAPFHGSTGAMRLNAPVVSMTVDPGDRGYWLYASDGGVFTFGEGLAFHGSLPGLALCSPPRAVAMRATTTGGGYYVAGADGSVFRFGDAPDHGDRPPLATGTTVIDLAVRP
jgi:lysophospholipase L1-like esterase